MIKELVYSAIDTVTGGSGVSRRFSGDTIRLPIRWARYFKTNYEPETFAFFHDSLGAGDVVLDIGAHIGLFTVVASRLVGDSGRVYSFEPTAATRKVLSEVVELNRCSGNVVVRSEAISDRCGKATFFDTGETISVMNSLVKNERSQTGYEVDLLALDDFVRSESVSPNCIKVDVEGAELDLLRGARETLANIRPKIRFSMHPPFIPAPETSIPEIWRVLEQFDYLIEFDGESVDKAWFCSQTSLFDVNLRPRT